MVIETKLKTYKTEILSPFFLFHYLFKNISKMSNVDRYDVHRDGIEKDRKRSRSRKPHQNGQSQSTMDNRPPWNNVHISITFQVLLFTHCQQSSKVLKIPQKVTIYTYIEGYDDVDEHGKFRKRGGGMPKTIDRQQEELTKNWTESLREQHHQPQKQ
eukprot:NP_492532.1 Uncharacterized protein CELE_C41G7.7 [Caenorhabditis elegans]